MKENSSYFVNKNDVREMKKLATAKIGFIKRLFLKHQGAADADNSAFEDFRTGEKITSYTADPELRSISVFMINEMRELDSDCRKIFKKSKCLYTVPSTKRKKGRKKRATYQKALGDITTLIETNKNNVSLYFFTYSRLLESLNEESEAKGEIGQRPEIKAMYDMRRAELRREYAIPANKHREAALSLVNEKKRILSLLREEISSCLEGHMRKIGIYYRAAQKQDPILPVKCAGVADLLSVSEIDLFSYFKEELEHTEAAETELLKLEKERKAESNEV